MQNRFLGSWASHFHLWGVTCSVTIFRLITCAPVHALLHADLHALPSHDRQGPTQHPQPPVRRHAEHAPVQAAAGGWSRRESPRSGAAGRQPGCAPSAPCMAAPHELCLASFDGNCTVDSLLAGEHTAAGLACLHCTCFFVIWCSLVWPSFCQAHRVTEMQPGLLAPQPGCRYA